MSKIHPLSKLARLPHRLSPLLSLVLFLGLTVSAQKPELVVRTGHVNEVWSIALSPDGRMIATGVQDSTIKLWDPTTGAELRTLTGHQDGVKSLAFSPDGKTLASGSRDATVKLWDPVSGAELKTFKGHKGDVTSLAFSADGTKITSVSLEATVNVWSIASGEALQTFQVQPEKFEYAVLSPGGGTLAAGHHTGPIKLIDIASRQPRELKGPSGGTYSLAFSPDGLRLATWRVGDQVFLWDVATGAQIRELNEIATNITSIAFDPTGKTLATGDYFGKVRVWDITNGAELRTMTGHTRPVSSLLFSRDGTMLLSGSSDKTVIVWEPVTGTARHTLKGHSDRVVSVALSPDGKTLAQGGWDYTIKLWDLATDAPLRTLRGHSFYVASVAFSPDGKLLASGSWDKTVKIWDVATGTVIRTTPEQADRIISVAFSPDGKLLASGDAGKKANIKLWNVGTGDLVRTVNGHTDIVTSVAFSPNGRTLASASLDRTVRLWNVATGAPLHTLPGHTLGVTSVAFHPAGNLLASASFDRTVRLWNPQTGRPIETLKGDDNAFIPVAFSPDGKLLAGGSWKLVRLWDVSSRREVRTLGGITDGVVSLAFSRNSKYLVGATQPGLNVWEVNTGDELARMIAVDENEWMAITLDGLFDGSPPAWNQIIWRFNNDTFNYAPVESYFGDFYYPGLVSEIFYGKRPKAKTDLAQLDRRTAKLGVSTDASGGMIGSRNLKVWIDVSEAPAGARDVRLFRNGSLVKVWRGDVLQGKGTVQLETAIPIVAGENRLTAYAFNNDNIKSQDASVVVTGAETLRRKGTAYVLAVGINQYANPAFNLKFAVADADEFAKEVQHQQSGLGPYEQIRIVPLHDAAATKANILSALAELAQKAQPEDAVVVYFAGHGLADGNRFYLIPHDLGYQGPRNAVDAAGIAQIFAHGISDQELEAALESVDAGHLLMVIDACNSGQALDAEEKRRGPMNSKGLAQLAYEKGMYILTAAQSYQAALEASRYGHGYLTFALVNEGLKTPAADAAPKDGQLLLREWLDFATIRVPQMQREKMVDGKAAAAGDRLLIQKVVAFANGEETIDPAERSLQRPRVFYRRETESQPMVVARLR